MDLPPGWHLSIEDRPSPAARNRLGPIKSTGFGRGGSIEAKLRSSLFLTLCWREMDSNFRFRVRCKPRLRPRAQREIPIGVHLIAGWPRWQLLSESVREP